MSTQDRTPDQETPAETATAVAAPPAPEAKAEGRSFAERVGQRKKVSTAEPFPIFTDSAAGVGLFLIDSKDGRQLAIQFGEGRFDAKPSQAVIDKVKEAGYRWSRFDRRWTLPVGVNSAMTSRIEAERLCQEVSGMIRQEKGIDAGQDVSR